MARFQLEKLADFKKFVIVTSTFLSAQEMQISAHRDLAQDVTGLRRLYSLARAAGTALAELNGKRLARLDAAPSRPYHGGGVYG